MLTGEFRFSLKCPLQSLGEANVIKICSLPPDNECLAWALSQAHKFKTDFLMLNQEFANTWLCMQYKYMWVYKNHTNLDMLTLTELMPRMQAFSETADETCKELIKITKTSDRSLSDFCAEVFIDDYKYNVEGVAHKPKIIRFFQRKRSQMDEFANLIGAYRDFLNSNGE